MSGPVAARPRDMGAWGACPTRPPGPTAAVLPQVIREVEDFAAAAGWDQPPQLFALVTTADLLAKQPELGGQVDPGSTLTPVAQEPLADDDLAEALAGIAWPGTVTGCALVQEIVVLPPDAEAELRRGSRRGQDTDPVDTDAAHRRRAPAAAGGPTGRGRAAGRRRPPACCGCAATRTTRTRSSSTPSWRPTWWTRCARRLREG